jgi:hypothetical protein
MTVFLTFGDKSYERALRRIEREAVESGFFDRLIIKRPPSLGRAFWRKHGKFVAANRRGYGYWLWKPWIVLEALAACRPGETLVYADAGCTINSRGRARFDQYRRMLGEASSGVLGFRLSLAERRFTKGDVFEALDAWHLQDTPQVRATIILWRSCKDSISIAREWLELSENYELISDAPSIAPNAPDFQKHRRDQSLFSLVAKLRGAVLIDDETEFGGDWEGAGAYPFWATRLRGERPSALERLRRDLSVCWLRVRHAL